MKFNLTVPKTLSELINSEKLRRYLDDLRSRINLFLSKAIGKKELRKDIISARINRSTEKIVLFSSLISLSVFITGAILSILLLKDFLLVISLLLTFLISILAFYLPKYYIKLIKDTRRRKINLDLGSAVTFMYALSSGNMKLPEIFRRLAIHEKGFGEISREAKYIVTEIDFFSSDLENAINELVKITPSKKLQDFLVDLIPVMRAGGDLTSYFKDKSEEYLDEAMEEQENFIEFLGYLSEGYIAGFVAGPLLIILGLVIMILSFGQAPQPLYYIIYLVLPLGGLSFIILLKTISPIDTLKTEELEINESYGTNSAQIDDPEEKVKTPYLVSIKNFFLSLIFDPKKTLLISIPITALFAIQRYLSIGLSGIEKSIETYSVIVLLLLATPISVFFEIKNRRRKKIRKEFPDFMRVLEGLNKTGMTLKKTFLEVSGIPGIVGEKLKIVKRGLHWDFNLNNLLKRFSNSLREKEITRSIIIILEGTRAHGNISSVLQITKKESIERKNLFEKRNIDIKPYIILVWVSFLIFLGTAYIFRTSFLGSVPSSGLATGRFGFSIGQIELISDIITHSTMIMGFISGIIAGELSEGTIYSGLKHSILMVLISYILFIWVI